MENPSFSILAIEASLKGCPKQPKLLKPAQRELQESTRETRICIKTLLCGEAEKGLAKPRGCLFPTDLRRGPARAVPAERLPERALVLGRAEGSGQVVTLELARCNGCNLSIVVLPPPLAG